MDPQRIRNFSVIAHIALGREDFRQLRGDRLLSLSGFRIRDKQPTMRQVELIPSGRENLAVPHRGVKPERDKEPKIRVGARDSRTEQCVALLIGQGDDTTRALGKFFWTRW